MKTRASGFWIIAGLMLFLPNMAFAASADLSLWLYNISVQIPSLIKLLIAISYVSGFGFLCGGVAKLRRCAQSATMMSSQENISGPLIHITVGVVLIYFAGFVNIGSVTLFGQGAAIAYQAGSGANSMFGSIIGPIILILRFIGYIAFIKGFYLLGRLGSHQAQQGTLGKALVHIVGGILAINIEATYMILLNSILGPTF